MIFIFIFCLLLATTQNVYGPLSTQEIDFVRLYSKMEIWLVSSQICFATKLETSLKPFKPRFYVPREGQNLAWIRPMFMQAEVEV